MVALRRMQPTHIISGFDRDEGEEGRMMKLYETAFESSCSSRDVMRCDAFRLFSQVNIPCKYIQVLRFNYEVRPCHPNFLVFGEMVASNSCDLSRQLWRTFRRPTAQTHREPERAKRSLAENFKTKSHKSFHFSYFSRGRRFVILVNVSGLRQFNNKAGKKRVFGTLKKRAK